MKILQVTSSITGGAGMSAKLLHEGLNSSGNESLLISRQSDLVTFKPKDIFLSRINTALNAIDTRKNYGFTSPKSISLLNSEELIVHTPEVIHIHNWYNLLSWKSMEKLISLSKVVLTMHDSRLLSGGCHVFLGCKEYSDSCSNCPAVYLGKSRIKESKKSLDLTFRANRNFHVITPSKWLAHEFRETFNNDNVHVVENLVQAQFENSFKPLILKNLQNLLFISSNVDAPFKGLTLLIDSLNQVFLNGMKIELTVVGNGRAKVLEAAKFPVTRFHNLGPEDLIQVMHENQLLIVPSLADNFPGVIKEAQLTGLPVLGTKIGGIIEMIEDRETGFLCDPTVESIVEILGTIVCSDLAPIALKARKFATEGRSNEQLIQKHLDVYREI